MRALRLARSGGALLLLAGLALADCNGAPAPEREARGAPPTGARTIRLLFERPGDDIGPPEDRALLEEIADTILARGAGEISGREFGMGRAELAIRAEGGDAAERIRALLAETHPEVRYRIEEGSSP